MASKRRAEIRGLNKAAATSKDLVRMAKFKPILITAAISIGAIIVYKKFLAGKFGLPLL